MIWFIVYIHWSINLCHQIFGYCSLLSGNHILLYLQKYQNMDWVSLFGPANLKMILFLVLLNPDLYSFIITLYIQISWLLTKPADQDPHWLKTDISILIRHWIARLMTRLYRCTYWSVPWLFWCNKTGFLKTSLIWAFSQVSLYSVFRQPACSATETKNWKLACSEIRYVTFYMQYVNAKDFWC